MEEYICLLLLPLSFQLNSYKVDELFEKMKREKLNASEAKNITYTLANFFNATYPFESIAKNPPQPSFNNTYFEKVDVCQKFRDYSITGDFITKYELFRGISLIIHELNDLHISIGLNSNFLNYYYALPLYLTIKMEDDKPVVYTKLITKTLREIFDESLIKKVESNLNNPVSKINGKSPLKYIEERCDNFYHVKNPHGSFSYNYLEDYGYNKLRSCPLSYKELKNFTLDYENGEKITTEYRFFNHEILKEEVKEKEIIWDHNNKNEFQCKIDKENKVNFIVNKSYNPRNLKGFYDALEGCFKSVYKNDYPIIYMTEKNRGGYGEIEHLISELLLPIHSFNEYDAAHKYLIDYVKTNSESFRNKDTFGQVNEKYLKNTSSNYYTNTFIEFSDESNVIKYTKNLIKANRKRIPTEIILLTDGFSYSASSCVIKGMQNRGSAITVGYLGNPLMSDYPFDSSHSCTGIIDSEDFIQINDYYLQLQKMGIEVVQISGLPVFPNKTSNDFPMEYQVFPVDEYFKFYEELNNDTYLSYVNQAKRIVEKYKTECNANNKKLLLISEECNNKFGDSHMHGGFECADDGKWSEKCMPSYCDEGYIFDSVDQKCIDSNIFFNFDISTNYGIPMFIAFMVLAVLIIAGLIYYIVINK